MTYAGFWVLAGAIAKTPPPHNASRIATPASRFKPGCNARLSRERALGAAFRGMDGQKGQHPAHNTRPEARIPDINRTVNYFQRHIRALSFTQLLNIQAFTNGGPNRI